MSIDKFVHLFSPIHNWDIRWKVASLIFLIFVFAAVKKFSALALLPVVAVTLFLATRIPWDFMFKTLKPAFIFLLVMTPLLILTAGGETVGRWGFVLIYKNGLLLSGQILIKSCSIMVIFITLFGTAKLDRIMGALRFFWLPPALVSIFLFTYRYIFLYTEDKEKLFTAAVLRGYNVKRKQGLQSVKTTVGLLVTLLIRSFEQSERMYAAMKIRGFNGDFYKIDEFNSSWADFFKSVFCLGCGLGLLVMEYFS